MKKIIIALFMVLAMAQGAQASSLPEDLWAYIKKELPDATQRFDSVVTLPNGVMFIPLYPIEKVAVTEIAQTYSYPAKRNLKSLPEVVIFNNDFVLLKVFKAQKGGYTITKNENLPYKVRLGVMPQDMLVPAGLQVPESLKLVMGNLEIPSVKSEDNVALSKEDKKERRGKKVSFIPLNELKSKRIYIASNSSKFIDVYDGTSKEPSYELKLSSLPSKILASSQSKFALVTYFASNTVEVIDLVQEKVIAKIELASCPKDADIDVANDLVYVSSADANMIYVVDLNSGKLIREIKLDQSPSRLSVALDGKSLAFIDLKTQELYSLSLNEEYVAKYVGKAKNVSKILAEGERVYTISRTDNKLSMYGTDPAELLHEYDLNAKPVDAIRYGNKIFILCAQSGVVDIFDVVEKKVVKTEQLDKKGFYSKITKVPNQANAVITGIGTNNYLMFNLENMNITRKQPFEKDVAHIMMIDK